MNKANECTCPSGDGSLRWPCPAHPAVEQACWDERKLSDLGNELHNLSCSIVHENEKLAEQIGGIARELWNWPQACAALAQPSPASDLDPHAEAFNEAPDEALRPEQAEAERSALWAVHAQGPDELYAAFSREDAEKHAAELNALPMPEGIAVGAVVVPSPWPAVQHWQYLAEQEQDHKNEIAGRLRQHERIGEALRAEITQLRQHKNDYMDAGQETYRALQNEIREREAEIARLDGLVSGHTAERDAALARVAELEMQEPVALANRGLHAFWVKWTEAAAGLYGPGIKLYAAPVAQAQHSVPGDIMRDAQRYRWLRDQQFYFSFSTENSDAGISSCTAGMSSRFKNLSWVDAAIDSAIAAAPGKEVGHE